MGTSATSHPATTATTASLEVRRVNSRADLRRFVYCVRELYSGNEHWSPPIWSDEFFGYSSKNPVLAHCDFDLLIALRGGRVVGRLMVYVDPRFNEHEERNCALFGAFDTTNDPEAAAALFDFARSWARERGKDEILGPINPIAEFWGVLLDAFDTSAVFLTPYNYSYYNDLLVQAGFRKEIDLWAYEADASKGYTLSPRYEKFAEIFGQRNPEFSVRPFNRRNLTEEAKHIHRISNISLAPNWGYVPVTEEVAINLVKTLKPIIDEHAIWFVEKDGVPVGFSLGWPDFNACLRKMRGRLLPAGWIHLFTTLPRVRDYRLFGLAVLPEYHGMGLDALMYIHMYKALKPRGIRLEANFILETNAKMNNALVRLGLSRTKTYRMYVTGL